MEPDTPRTTEEPSGTTVPAAPGHTTRTLDFLRRARRNIGSTVLIFHCGALAFANFPSTTGLGKWPKQLFDPYLKATGQHQYWSMFSSRPRYANLDARVTAQWSHSRKNTYGPLLPGHEPYHSSIKLDAFFARLASSDRLGPEGRRYHTALCESLIDSAGRHPESVQLIVEADVLSPLEVVRSTGKLAVSETLKGPVVACR